MYSENMFLKIFPERRSFPPSPGTRYPRDRRVRPGRRETGAGAGGQVRGGPGPGRGRGARVLQTL